jgi:cyclic pyranopterin phosphate synthase
MRKVDYLRISVTDRCNERCTYCMPEGFRDWEPHDQILTYEELLRVADVATKIGFRKFRITGGEPLLRRDIVSFVERLASISGVEYLTLSTNATLLTPMARPLADAGVRGVNISLDTLDAEAYHRITGVRLEKCLSGLRAAIATKTMQVKLNVVLIRDINEEQLLPLARLAAVLGIPIRFIELMPVTSAQVLTPQSFYSAFEARERLSKHLALEPLDGREAPRGYGPAVYYKARWNAEGWRETQDAVRSVVPDITKRDDPPRASVIGLISPMTDHRFCDDCNKVRLTPDGKLRPCLGNHLEFDLRSVLRSGGSDEDLRKVILAALGQKPEKHEFLTYDPNRRMSAIGG